jgi:hypothetical protein
MTIILPVVFTAALVALWTIPDLLRNETNYISFVLGFLAAVLAPSSIPQEKFYELTAQIVPVLFVALAVETQAFQISSVRTSPRVLTEVFLAVPALGLAIAGYESLRVVVVGQATRGRFDVVIGALIAAGASLTISAFVGRPRSTKESGGTPSNRPAD